MSSRVLSKNFFAIKRIEDCFVLYRWLSLGLAVILSIVGNNNGITLLNLGAAFSIAFILNLFLTVYSSNCIEKVKKYPYLLGLDILICASLLYLTGGWRSPFYAYAINPILVGAYIQQFKGAFVSATGLGLLALIFQYFGSYDISEPLRMETLPRFAAIPVGLFLVASFSAIYFNVLDNLREELDLEKTQNERILAFYKACGAINSSLQLKKVLNLAVSNAYDLTDSKSAVLGLFYEEEGLEIDPNTILVRDNGKVYHDAELKNQVDGFVKYTAENNGPVLLNSADLEQDYLFGSSNIDSLICLPLVRKGKYIGLMACINPKSSANLNSLMLLEILGNLASAAIENARLLEKGQNLMIVEERNRIARDMHDGLAQSLFSLILNIEVCEKLFDSKPELVKQKIADLKKLAEHNLAGTRQYIYDLCPGDLKKLGLPKALDVYTKEFTSINGLKADFEIAGARKNLPQDIEKALYYITQEALSNARKHARAKNVCVQLSYSDRRVILSIEDDGHGFDVDETLTRIVDWKRKGLSNIRKRAKMLGGECTIDSDQWKGTRIEIVIPVLELAT